MTERNAQLRAFVREVANLLTAHGATDYESATAALAALRLVGDDATTRDVLCLAASLATLYARAMSDAAYGSPYETTERVRVERLAQVEQIGVLAGRAFTFVMEFASSERPGWRNETGVFFLLDEDVRTFE